MRALSTRCTHALAALLAVASITVAGCSDNGGAAEPQSPITNEDVPAMDIANLPDIETTRTQMADLIESVRTEVTRLVPASAPWETKYQESRAGCKRDGKQGVTLYFAKLVSPRRFTPEEWAPRAAKANKLSKFNGDT